MAPGVEPVTVTFDSVAEYVKDAVDVGGEERETSKRETRLGGSKLLRDSWAASTANNRGRAATAGRRTRHRRRGTPVML